MNNSLSKNIMLYVLYLAIALVAGIFIGYRFYYYSPWFHRIDKAIAVIHPTRDSKISGQVTFVEKKDGLHISVKCQGLTPGDHGFHIHTFGDARCEDAFCNHFNPTNSKHGGPDSEDRHVGDLGNITANAEGTATLEVVDKQLSLNGPESIVGRSVIIHENADDLVSQPSGNAGARIAYGIVGIAHKE